MKIIKRNLITILGVAIGAIGGYVYWRYVGCNGGSCPITSSPLYTTLFGAIFGGLLFSIFQDWKKK